MALPEDKFQSLFNKLPSKEKESIIDYMEFLMQKAARRAWDEIEEVDKPLTEKEKAELLVSREDEECLSMEDLKQP